jgi:hypothetical protein
MQVNDTKRIPEDEVDLSSIGGRINRMISYPFRLWIGNIKTTLLFILAAVLLAIAIKLFIPRVYRSSFIIRPNDKTEKFHLKIFADIQGLLRKKDYSTVSQELKIDLETAKSIVKIDTYNPYIKNRTDSINNTEVTIDTYEPNNLLNIQNRLLDYLEANPYYKKIKDLQKKQSEENLELVEKDLDRLNKLKQLQIENYGKGTSGNNLLLSDLVNPTAMYSMVSERMNKKAMIQAQLTFLNNFQLIKSCIHVKRHVFPPRILVMCLILIPVFLLLCFIFLHYKNRRRYITYQ